LIIRFEVHRVGCSGQGLGAGPSARWQVRGARSRMPRDAESEQSVMNGAPNVGRCD
jgi:hypothetical protein